MKEKEKVRERGKKVADVKEKGKEEEEIQIGHHGLVGNPQVSNIYWLPYQEVTFMQVR